MRELILVHISSKQLWQYIGQNKLLYDADMASILMKSCTETMERIGSKLAYLNMKEAVFFIAPRITDWQNDFQLVSAAASAFASVVNQNVKISDQLFTVYADLMKHQEPKPIIDFIGMTTKNAEYASMTQIKNKLADRYEGFSFESIPSIYTRGICVAFNFETYEFDSYISQSPKDVFQQKTSKYVNTINQGWVRV